MVVAYLLKIGIPVLFLAYGIKIHYREVAVKNRLQDLDTIDNLSSKILLLTNEIELAKMREEELEKEIKSYKKYVGEEV